MSPPKIIFGAGAIGTTAKSFTFTWDTPEKVASLLSQLEALGINELDSGASYPPGNAWSAETLLGKAKAVERGFIIDSKIASHETLILNDVTIPASIDRTLALLGTSRILSFSPHLPDPQTPVRETAAAYHKQYLAGKFEKLGLSNYTATQLEEYLAVCEENDYVKPSLYSGHYNALFRSHEQALIPLLRTHNIAYYAFSPLAGGFLTGKVTMMARDDPSLVCTRWVGESMMEYYQQTFDRPEAHAALRRLHTTCKAHDISLAEVSLRWIMHHSALGADDGIIIGAKRAEQLKGNVHNCRKGPLVEELRLAVEEMWESVKEVMDEGNWR